MLHNLPFSIIQLLYLATPSSSHTLPLPPLELLLKKSAHSTPGKEARSGKEEKGRKTMGEASEEWELQLNKALLDMLREKINI